MGLQGPKALLSYMAQHSSCLTLEVALSPISRISIKFNATEFTSHSLGVVLAEALPRLTVTDPQRLIPMPIAVARLASLGRGIPETARFTVLTEFAFSPVFAKVTLKHLLVARRVIVTATVDRAISPCPPEITLALVIRWTFTEAVDTGLKTGPFTGRSAVSEESTSAVAVIRPMRVGTLGLLVTVMQTQATFVHIRTLSISPFGFLIRGVQSLCTVLRRPVKVSLHTNALNWIIPVEAPATAQRSQTGCAIGVP